MVTHDGSSQDTVHLHLRQSTFCGVNSIRMIDEVAETLSFNCYTPPEGNFIDWIKMQSDGLI